MYYGQSRSHRLFKRIYQNGVQTENCLTGQSKFTRLERITGTEFSWTVQIVYRWLPRQDAFNSYYCIQFFFGDMLILETITNELYNNAAGRQNSVGPGPDWGKPFVVEETVHCGKSLAMLEMVV